MTDFARQRSAAQITCIVLAVILQIGATFLPQFGIGEPIGSRSDRNDTLITPAGWAFAIWGPLFFGSACYAIWQARPDCRSSALLERIGWWSAGALGAQGVWALYTQSMGLGAASVVIILFSLFCLLAIMRAIVALPRRMTTGERWLVGLLFTALAAWLTVASIVNVSSALVFYGFDTGDAEPVVAALVVLTAGIIAGAAIVRSRGAPWFAMVFEWALLAIYLDGGQRAPLIAYASIAAAVIVGAAALVTLSDRRNRHFWTGW